MPRITHFEIHAKDPQRAIKFYQNIFSWKFSKWEGPDEYWLISTGPEEEPGINGGLVRRRGEIDGTAVIAFVCTIEVASVDKTAIGVEANGGKIVLPKSAIPGVGWMASCKDTEGNIFSIMQSDPGAK